MMSPDVSCFVASTQWQLIVFRSAGKGINSNVSRFSNWATLASIANHHCSASGPLRASPTFSLSGFSDACIAHGIFCLSVWVELQSDLIQTRGELDCLVWACV